MVPGPTRDTASFFVVPAGSIEARITTDCKTMGSREIDLTNSCVVVRSIWPYTVSTLECKSKRKRCVCALWFIRRMATVCFLSTCKLSRVGLTPGVSLSLFVSACL